MRRTGTLRRRRSSVVQVPVVDKPPLALVVLQASAVGAPVQALAAASARWEEEAPSAASMERTASTSEEQVAVTPAEDRLIKELP